MGASKRHFDDGPLPMGEDYERDREYARRLSEAFDRHTMARTVCLVGSTRFAERFRSKNKELSLMGYVVYSVAFTTTAEPTQDDKVESIISPHAKLMLDAVHMGKIINSDRVHVLNVDGYVGESTTREIYFAHVMGKEITWEATFVEVDGVRMEPVEALFRKRLGFWPTIGGRS